MHELKKTFLTSYAQIFISFSVLHYPKLNNMHFM